MFVVSGVMAAVSPIGIDLLRHPGDPEPIMRENYLATLENSGSDWSTVSMITLIATAIIPLFLAVQIQRVSTRRTDVISAAKLAGTEGLAWAALLVASIVAWTLIPTTLSDVRDGANPSLFIVAVCLPFFLSGLAGLSSLSLDGRERLLMRLERRLDFVEGSRKSLQSKVPSSRQFSDHGAVDISSIRKKKRTERRRILFLAACCGLFLGCASTVILSTICGRCEVRLTFVSVLVASSLTYGLGVNLLVGIEAARKAKEWPSNLILMLSAVIAATLAIGVLLIQSFIQETVTISVIFSMSALACGFALLSRSIHAVSTLIYLEVLNYEILTRAWRDGLKSELLEIDKSTRSLERS